MSQKVNQNAILDGFGGCVLFFASLGSGVTRILQKGMVYYYRGFWPQNDVRAKVNPLESSTKGSNAPPNNKKQNFNPPPQVAQNPIPHPHRKKKYSLASGGKWNDKRKS